MEDFSGTTLHVPATRKREILIGFSNKVEWQEQRTIADREGQFLVTQGLIRNKLWTLTGIYGPQTKKAEFYKSLMKTLEELTEGNLMVMGDFNVVIGRLMDKSAHGSPHSEIPNVFQHWMRDKGLSDCWRLQNTQCRDYTLFSNLHKSYSRIDYILVKQQPSIKILGTNIDSRTFSDHAAVLITWSQEGYSPSRQWKLDNYLLLN